MILTGKAKEDFLKAKIGNETNIFESMLPIYRNALIIEWFDEIKHPKIQIVRIIWNTWSNSTLSYKDAVIEAIKKANEIYNEKK